MDVLKDIKHTLRLQAASLRSMEKFIGAPYRDAVNAVLKCRGKIIVTGIGKSGLIAQKIASTLSSTGTPALYLHPTEGLHGNLGVVDKKDVVLAIGKSGESAEILALIPALRRIGAKIIALTSNSRSTLARQSAIVLHMPIRAEACPLNLAPTTSSTVALVIGDALAIALMKRRGFGAENFALFHPGGLIGKRLLLRVSDVMRGGRRNPIVNIRDTMDHLMVEIARKWTGAASIVDKRGKLVGLVTDFDIRRAFAEGKSMKALHIADIMNPRPVSIFSDEMATRALAMMESRKKPLTVLPAVDRRGRSVGMIHLHDLVTHGLLQDSQIAS